MADEEFMFGDLFATVRVQDLPASREVVAVERQENGTWRVCGSAIANTDGIAELGIEGSKTSRVYAFAIDHWGEPFTPNRSVAYGDIIRPSVFLGWLYHVTAPGVLPGEEPVWWNSTPGMPRPVGTAMAQAEMYFQPIAHGPVDIEWEEKGVGDPHWDKVVSLLHFDGDLTDETGRTWAYLGNVSFDPGVFGDAFSASSGGWAVCSDLTDVHFDSDYCIEAWVLPSTVSAQYAEIFTKRQSGSVYAELFIRLEGDRVGYGLTSGSTWFARKSVATISAGVGFWIALVKDGTQLKLYLNGALDSFLTVPLTPTFTSAARLSPVSVGALSDGSVPFSGKIDELRITKGVARYTEDFTPPTEPFPNFK